MTQLANVKKLVIICKCVTREATDRKRRRDTGLGVVDAQKGGRLEMHADFYSVISHSYVLGLRERPGAVERASMG
jgi:hypothetical protein